MFISDKTTGHDNSLGDQAILSLVLDGLSLNMMVGKKSVVQNTNTNKYTLIVLQLHFIGG